MLNFHLCNRSIMNSLSQQSCQTEQSDRSQRFKSYSIIIKLEAIIIITRMIDQDYKFFRQNFSASSFSEQTSQQQSYFMSSQTKTPNTSVKVDSKMVMNGYKDHVQQPNNNVSGQILGQKGSRAEGKLGSNWVEAGKQVQLKILQKLKTQHKGIKSLNSQERLPEGPHEQQKLDSSQSLNKEKNATGKQAQSISVKQTNTKNKQIQTAYQQIKQNKEITRLKQNSGRMQREIEELKDSRTKQVSIYEQKISTFNQKIQVLSSQVRQKQTLIKRLRKNEAALEQKYTNEVRQFQSQLEDSIETITSLRKEILQKDNEIDDLKQTNRMISQNPELFQVQQELLMLKNREKGYIETIQRLQQQNMSDNYPGISTYINNRDPNAEIAAQITRLRQSLSDRDQKWNQRLIEAIERERKINLIQLQKLISKQGPISFGSEERIEHVGSLRQDIAPTLDRLVAEIQQLKKVKVESNPPSVVQQLKFIKEFITRLQKNQKQISHHSSEGEGPDTTQLLKIQLANYKKFILEEEKSKRAFLEELNLYRSQNLQIINENTYLRHQLGTIQHHMDVSPAVDTSKYIEEINHLRIEIQEQNDKIEQYEHQVGELHDQLVNTQPQRPMILNRNSDHELHNEIQRLHQIIQAESQYFIKVNTQITHYFQSQIGLYEQRVRLYEQNIKATQAYLKQNEMRLHQISSRHLGDQASIVQSNQIFQAEASQFRTELGGLITTNRQLQTQIREQSEQVDELWRTKQQELHGEMLVIEKMKGHHQ